MINKLTRRRAIAFVAGPILVAAALAACSSSGGNSASGMKTIKFGCNRELSEVFIWHMNPFLKKYNLKIDCREFPNYTASLQGLARGDIDVGILGVPQVATIGANNLDSVKVISGYSLSGQNVVINSADKDVTTWDQLSGKTLGVPSGTGVQIMLNVALDQHHLLGKVHVTDAGFNPTTVLLAMQKKQWDAAAYWSPVADQIVSQGYGQYVSGVDLNCTTVGPAEGLIGATTKFLSDRTEVVNLLKGFAASMQAELADPEQWAKDGAELTGSPLDVNIAATKRQQPSYIIDAQAAKNLAPYGPKLGFATSDATSKIDGVIDASFLAKATGKSESEVTGRAVLPASKGSCST